MFKNAQFFRIDDAFEFPSLETFQELLANRAFVPCEPTQQLSTGFTPLRDEVSPLAEVIDGQLLFKVKSERKAVPGPVVKRELEARCRAIEEQTGRKPGRKEKVDLKAEIVTDLLPRAFSKFQETLVWVNRKDHYLVVDAGSRKACDDVLALLAEAMADGGTPIPMSNYHTQQSPGGAMAAWLTEQEAPEPFTLGREVELRTEDEEKSVVRYARHDLELEEIVRYISQGKMPVRMALGFDNRCTFALGSDLSIKKFDSSLALDEVEGGFDADVTLVTRELSLLWPAVLQVLGGEAPAPGPGGTPEDEADGA